MMLAEVVLSDQVFAAGAAVVTAIILGLLGWVLSKVVTLSEIIARLESQIRALEADQAAHDARILRLERR